QMLYLSVAKTIKPKVDFLRDQVGIPSKHLPAVIKRAPRLLFTSVENTLQPNLNFFTQELQVPADKLAETLSKSPSLLTRSLLTHLHPVAAFLSEEAGLSPAAITRLLLDQPQVMMSSLEEKLRTNLTILREHLRLNPSQISRILTSEPKLLGASVDTALSTSLLTKAMFLARQLSLTPEEVGKMACVMPSLLIMSTEGTLRPKIAFLLNDFHALPSDIASFPQALGYSLEGRILPRLEHLVASGADVGAISLPSILAPTNQVFAKRYSPEAIQRRVEKGEDQKRKREAKLSRVPRPPPVPREPRPSPLQNLAPPGKYGGEDWWQEEEVEDEEEWVMRGALALGGGRRRERSNSKLSRNHSALLVLRALTKRYGTARNSESLARVRAAADARLALRAEMLREAGIDPFYALPLDDFDGGRSAVFSSP
ncbi:mTERF-domain-containing protein, partial [Baffinella frigidus]